MTKPQKIEGGKTRPLTEERLREIIREELSRLLPVPYPQPTYPEVPRQFDYQQHRCSQCGMWLNRGQAHMCAT